MPVHDWTRVKAGIFHALHLNWISALAHALNHGLLPGDYYALPEQFVTPYYPDVLTLKGPGGGNGIAGGPVGDANSERGAVLTAPRLKPIAEADLDFYRHKQRVVAVRHASDDELVAVVEIVSAGNKAGKKPFREFVAKAADLIAQGIHLLVIDLYPPGKRDPQGIHGEIWQEIAGEEYSAPKEKPLTLASYETGGAVRAYVVPVAVGDTLTEMPLFLEPQKAVTIPLEATYSAAFAEIPERWRRVVEQPD